MALNLTLNQQEELEKVVLKAYDLNGLERMLRLKLGFKLGEEMNTNRGLKYVVSDLVQKAVDDGWIEKLIIAAKEGAPQNLPLQEFVSTLNIKPVEKLPKENIVTGEQGNRLEKAVRKRAPLIPFAAFTSKLSAIGSRICRIEIPKGTAQGTGWLVGPDLIMTAYHVIEKVVKEVDGLADADIVCRFDYLSATINQHALPGRICKVAVQYLVDYSPYSRADLEATNDEPGPEELDYALIRLHEAVGNDLLDGDIRRGFIEVPENPPVMTENDFVIIPQHPDGRMLELALGEILKYNKIANRVQYDANTEPGSSGSPCFTINLVPFGLHHASGPANNLAYNQGVPLRSIIKLLKKRNISPFWT